MSIHNPPPPPPATVDVVTYHNDNNRTGWNSNEVTLTVGNVRKGGSAKFGQLSSTSVDGRVDAQPLVVRSESIAGAGVHDVVYLATENDSVYAIDADAGGILRARNLGTSIPYTAKDGDDNIYPTIGIASTPVIDLGHNAIYLVTDTNEGSTSPDVYRLHKLALNDFTDIVPPQIVAPATTLSNGSTYLFPPSHERQRAGLLESNGTIYVGFSSTGDRRPGISRGAIAGFNAGTLAPLAADIYPNRLVTTSAYYLSSIWQSGYGLAADAYGHVFFATGNSDPNYPSFDGTYNFPDSVLQLSPDLATIVGTFTVYNYFALDQGDGDLASAGTMVVPDQANATHPRLLVAGGKQGISYVLNRDAMGGFTAGGPNRDLAELPEGACWCGPAYYVGADGIPRILTGGRKGLESWKLYDTTSSFGIANEASTGAAAISGNPDNGGAVPAVSSSGTTAGSAVVWFVEKPTETTSYTMTLKAYAATDFSAPIFSAAAGNWTNYNSNATVIPTVANGFVYVASNKQLRIFGLR